MQKYEYRIECTKARIEANGRNSVVVIVVDPEFNEENEIYDKKYVTHLQRRIDDLDAEVEELQVERSELNEEIEEWKEKYNELLGDRE